MTLQTYVKKQIEKGLSEAYTMSVTWAKFSSKHSLREIGTAIKEAQRQTIPLWTK